jgi:hypothetical protein
MTDISRQTTLKELAGIVGTAFAKAGVEAVLTGGAAVSIYTDNVYQTYDLDFVSRNRMEIIATALKPIGFQRESSGRYFTSSHTDFLIEFPAHELSFGETTISMSDTTIASTSLGSVRIITPTQLIMDRLAAYVHWGDNPSFEQALMIVQDNPIEWSKLFEWATLEKVDTKIIEELQAHQERIGSKEESSG